MGIPILALGPSGSGKTTAIRNMDRKSTVLCAVEKQRLPFREPFPMTVKMWFDIILLFARC